MTERVANPLAVEFEDLVRTALLHLYDTPYLSQHPLAKLVDAPPASSPTARGKLLLQALLDAIEWLHPAPGTPADSRVWRDYRLMELRYIGGMDAVDVVAQLNISQSQYQRDHARALEEMATWLRDRWQLEGREPAAEPGSRESLALNEAEQMAGHLNLDYTDLPTLLEGLLALLQPICAENHVATSLHARRELPPVRSDRIVLRQVFLGLLNTALERCVGGTLSVSLAVVEQVIETTIVASPSPEAEASWQRGSLASPEIEVAHRLIKALGGEVAVGLQSQSGPWQASVNLPVAQRSVVLVVDNQQDFIDLIARYLARSGWQVVGAHNVQQAQSLAQELRPNAILLDVLLPGQDAWGLLVTLKGHPETKQIPVIVCSVLYQPQVARALGAIGYLAKPISQTVLLEALAPFGQGKHASERAY